MGWDIDGSSFFCYFKRASRVILSQFDCFGIRLALSISELCDINIP